jgi:ribosomal protein L30/L7E
VTVKDTPETRGMIFKIRHLVTVATEGAESAEKKK